MSDDDKFRLLYDEINELKHQHAKHHSRTMFMLIILTCITLTSATLLLDTHHYIDLSVSALLLFLIAGFTSIYLIVKAYKFFASDLTPTNLPDEYQP
ncbi:hypothetical protein JD969_09495 [Planctomycetota bacterium]|nr:hypothetical protein JD969_09495 [Planctomycetota bacterium]